MSSSSEGESIPAGEPVPVVFVDAENVRRSAWPNVSREELVRLVVEWAEREGVDARVVFERRDGGRHDRAGVGEPGAVLARHIRPRPA